MAEAYNLHRGSGKPKEIILVDATHPLQTLLDNQTMIIDTGNCYVATDTTTIIYFYYTPTVQISNNSYGGYNPGWGNDGWNNRNLNIEYAMNCNVNKYVKNIKSATLIVKAQVRTYVAAPIMHPSNGIVYTDGQYYNTNNGWTTFTINLEQPITSTQFRYRYGLGVFGEISMRAAQYQLYVDLTEVKIINIK